MDLPLPPLRASVDRLESAVRRLDDAQLRGPSYCSGWTVAQVLSHLGSAGTIMLRNVADALGGTTAPDDFTQSVWDEWNAKAPRAQAVDSLAVDASLLDALAAVSQEDRARCTIALGPVNLSLDEAIGLRVNEHTFHTWDIEVMSYPAATLPPAETAFVIDNLGMIASFVARPTGEVRDLSVHTSAPERDFTLRLSADAAVMEAGAAGDPDVTLPAESFCRLVYGRLDPAHTPAGLDEAALATLRKVFPGL